MTPVAKQIELALQDYFNAFMGKDWKRFGAMLDDTFTYYTDNCVIQTKEEFLLVLSKDTWQVAECSVSDLKVIVSAMEELAVAHYKAEFKGSKGTFTLTLNATETTVFQRSGDGWAILHSHTSNK
jgi:uncharacterized protein YpbB